MNIEVDKAMAMGQDEILFVSKVGERKMRKSVEREYKTVRNEYTGL